MEKLNSSSDARRHALEGLHLLLQEKDQNAKFYNEKAVKYERALRQAECRIARLMQLHAGAAAAASTVEAGASSVTLPFSVAESSENCNVSPMNSSRESTLTSGKVPVQQKRSRLVTDGNFAPNAIDSDLQNDNLVPRGPRIKFANGQRTTTLDNDDLETDGDGPFRPAGTRAGGTAGLPGVSRVLFDNAIKENVRLKKMLQETLQKDGTNVKVFLERQEYADVIKQLRAELATEHNKVEELQRWIAMQKAGQSQQLLVQMLELQNRVQHLTKEGQVKSAMVENCLKENDKLRNESTLLKSKQGGSVGGQGLVNQLKQTVDGLTKQLESERKKHHHQIQQLMETTQINTTSITPDNDLESLRNKITKLEFQIQNETEAKELQREQLHSYEEDYRKLQHDVEKIKEKYEKEITKLQGQITSVQKDKQRIEREFTRERQKTQNMEGLIRMYAPQVFKSTGGVPMSTCAQQFKEPWMMNPSHQSHMVLVQDGGPQSIKPKKSTLRTDGATDGGGKKSGSDRTKSASPTKGSSSSEGTFKCEKCYRTDFSSLEHYQDHVSKCVP